MPRKSKIKTLEAGQRALIERLLREDKLTLDEMIEVIRAEFPENTPSRSSLGRYRKSFDEMAGRMRDIQAASSALVSELGEDVDDRAGALLAQAVTTLAVNCALEKNDPGAEVSVAEVGELARAARAVMQARTMSLKERQAIEQAARARALAEAADNVEAAAVEKGMSQEQVQFWRQRVLFGR